jgi:hypothetical protein
MQIARKSTVILVLVLAAFLIALIPKLTVADDNGARIGKLDCASGEIAKFDGSVWVCSPDDNTDTLGGLSCSDGQIAKFIGSVWVCSADDDTLGGLDCNDGEVAQFNDSLGSSGEWECVVVDGGGGPSDCPPGFVVLNAKVCIEQNEKASADTWYNANRACINADYRLCSTGEWIAACENATIADATGNWEWTDDSSGTGFMTLGFDRCTRFIGQGPTFPQYFRCCVDR